jgi:hypothetical protein
MVSGTAGVSADTARGRTARVDDMDYPRITELL